MTKYQLVALSEVLRPSRDEVSVEPLETYHGAGIYSFGRGLFKKPPLTGAETSYSKFYRLHQDKFVYSRLFAWEGAFAVVAPEFDGLVVSHEFPTFEINRDRAEPAYLSWICRWPWFWEEMLGRTKGVGLRRQRVHPERVLETSIPLPSLPEQKRVVDWLNGVSNGIERLRSQTSASLEAQLALVPSILGNLFADGSWSQFPLRQHAEVFRGKGPTYQPGSAVFAINQACVRWEGLDTSRAREVDPNWVDSLPAWAFVRPLDVLVNSTGEGTIGRACVLQDSAPTLPFDSHVLVVRSNPDRLYSPYLAMYLRSPQGRATIEAAKSAKTTKQTELGKEKLEGLAVPLPKGSVQRKLVEFYERVRETADRCIGLRRGSIMKAEVLQVSAINHALGN